MDLQKLKKDLLRDHLAETEFRDDHEIVKPKTLLAIRGKTVLNENSFMIITGLPKSRKTTFLNIILASSYFPGEFMNFKLDNEIKNNILLIDCEQNDYDFSRQLSWFKKYLNVDKKPKNFKCHLYREHDPERIFKDLPDLIETRKPKIVIIDTLTDLAYDPNDLKEAGNIKRYFKALTKKYNVGVILILHSNKTNKLPTGNLGSVFERSSQSIINVEKDDQTDISTMTATRLRSDQNFDPISIAYDHNTHQYELTDTPDHKEPVKEKSKAFSMDQFTDNDHKSRISIAFEHQEEHNYKSLYTSLQTAYGVGETITRRTIIPYLTYKKWIKAVKGIYTNNSVITRPKMEGLN